MRNELVEMHISQIRVIESIVLRNTMKAAEHRVTRNGGSSR
ncbi:MAG: hypothetical protein ABI811_19565 [Acidobacteriota bacterium]